MPSLTYAIGDIHGCRDQLTRLLAKIRHHSGDELDSVVFLGDYIDRGPDSAAVVETVRKLQERSSDRVVCLKGNHEAMLLEVLAEPRKVPWWLHNGGDAALASFGVEHPSQIQSDIVQWIASLPTMHEDARRFYVHAGFRPGAPVQDSDEHTRLWIREPFLSADYDFGKHVVHGHTPLQTASPDARRYRTNLDTAAVFGGALTAGAFSQDQDLALEYLQV